MNARIIPRLEIKNDTLVKGVHLEGLRVLGNPHEFALHFYEEGADELFYIDVVASLYGRNSLLGVIEKTAREIFVPITVGGGLRTVEDMRKVLCAGGDKIAINTAAVKTPSLISEAANRFGSSTIVVSIEAKKRPDGSYEAYIDSGRERTGLEVVAWAQKAAALGAGEIVITSIDNEGTGRGFDIELIRRISSIVNIPVLACGGAGKPEDIAPVFEEGHANGVLLSSIIHYDYLRRRNSTPNGGPEQPGAPLSVRNNTRIQASSIGAIKRALVDNGIETRTL
jgi:cyclase